MKIASQKGGFRFASYAHTNIQNTVGGGHQHAKAFALGIASYQMAVVRRLFLPNLAQSDQWTDTRTAVHRTRASLWGAK